MDIEDKLYIATLARQYLVSAYWKSKHNNIKIITDYNYHICNAMLSAYNKLTTIRLDHIYQSDDLLEMMIDYKPSGADFDQPWFATDDYGCRKRIDIINNIIAKLKNQIDYE